MAYITLWKYTDVIADVAKFPIFHALHSPRVHSVKCQFAIIQRIGILSHHHLHNICTTPLKFDISMDFLQPLEKFHAHGDLHGFSSTAREFLNKKHYLCIALENPR